MITTRLLSSLDAVFPGRCEGSPLSDTTVFQNEPFSFQLAYRITDGSGKAIPFYVRVASELPVRCYHVACVPVIHTDFPPLEPTQPVGLYPDILIPKAVNPPLAHTGTWGSDRWYEEGEDVMLFAYNDSWQALWFCLNEDGGALPAGRFTVRLELFSRFGEKMGEETLPVMVLEAALPAQTLVYTNWFHYDCLADWYGAELFSERYFEIMRDFVRKATRNGMNMLLLPAFTPPLDTPVGRERMTAQLVRVSRKDGAWSFDFSLMERFIDMCLEDGVAWFEHSHFFTQWGARHAPKIMAETDGKTERVFGWETEAAGEEYIGFLRAYLKALRPFLRKKGLEQRVLFHLSDEPGEDCFPQYKAVHDGIADLLEGCVVGDALSDVRYFDSGLVRTPIAMTSHADQFVGRSDDIWVYYIGGNVNDGMSNRLIQMPRARNRSLGVQLYQNNVKGFLHWGHNFYYGELCFGRIDPFISPCGGYPNAGTSYCVYPARDGTAYQSVRQKVFAEGLTDIRALRLLEALSGRAACEALIGKYFGRADFHSAVSDPAIFAAFRAELTDAIRRAS